MPGGRVLSASSEAEQPRVMKSPPRQHSFHTAPCKFTSHPPNMHIVTSHTCHAHPYSNTTHASLLFQLHSRVKARPKAFLQEQCRLLLITPCVSPLPRQQPRPLAALSFPRFPPRRHFNWHHARAEDSFAFQLRVGRNHNNSHRSKHARAASAPMAKRKKPASTNVPLRPLRWVAASLSPALKGISSDWPRLSSCWFCWP